MPTVDELATLIGNALTITFGHPFIAGAVLIITIFAILYKSRVPADAAIVLAVPLTIALAGTFMPNWIQPFIFMGLAIIIALGFLKLLQWL